MIKSIFRIAPPFLIGGLLGFYLHDLSRLTGRNVGKDIETSQKTNEGAAALRSPEPATQSTGNLSDRRQDSPHGLSVGEIQATLRRLKDVADVNQRAQLRNALLQQWALLDRQGAFDYANSLDEGEFKIQAMGVITEVLARSDPKFLAEKVMTLPGGRVRNELIQNLAHRWSETDACAALLWATRLPENQAKNDALGIIRFQLGAQNPEAASIQLNQLPDGDPRSSLINSLATQWGTRDPAEAIEWANTLPEAEKTRALSLLTGAWSKQDPLEAGWFVRQLPAGEIQHQTAISVASSWASESPEMAAAWLLQFPDIGVQEQGIREVVSAWARSNTQSAGDWAKELPAGKIRDVALVSFAENAAYWSPAKAATLTGLIEDPQKREQSMEIIVRSWAETDPESVRKWLVRLEAGEDVKARLRAFLPGG